MPTASWIKDQRTTLLGKQCCTTFIDGSSNPKASYLGLGGIYQPKKRTQRFGLSYLCPKIG